MSSEDLKELEGDEASSSDEERSDAEQSELEQLEQNEANDFGYHQEKPSRMSNLKKNASSSKAKVAAMGIIGIIVIVAVIMMMMLSQLKVIHFGQILAASGYARFNGIMQERTTQDIFDASVVEGEGTVQTQGRSLVDRIKLRNIDNQLSALGRDGKFNLELENDRLTKVKFEGGEVSIDEIAQRYGKSNYKELSLREKMGVRAEFSRQLETAVNENLALEPRYVQGRIFGTIADKVGFKFSRWRNAGRDFLGKKAPEAIAEDNANSNKEISGEGVPSGNDTVDEAAKKYKNEDLIKKNIEDNGGVFDKKAFDTAIEADIDKATGLSEAASKVSIAALAVSAACMANLTFSHVDQLAEENETSASKMGLQVLAARDQIKAGKVTSEAYDTAAAQLNGAENSAAYQYETNQPIDMTRAEQPKVAPKMNPQYADMLKTLTSPSRFSGIGAVASLFPGGSALDDKADEKFCNFVLSPPGMAAIAAGDVVVQVVAGFLTGGGEVAVEDGAGRAGFTIAMNAVKDALFETAGSLLSVEGVAKTGGTLLAFGGYSLLLRYVAMAFSGSTFSGSEQGPGYYERAAVGTNVVQNRQVRSQYGRPIDPNEAKDVDKQYASALRNGWNQKGFSERYFAIDNPFSLVGTASVYAPTTLNGSFQTLRKGFTNLGAVLRPFSSLEQTFGLVGANNKVYAAENNSYNPYGDQLQWGFSPDELDKMRNDPSYSITENEKHISQAQISALDNEIGSCFDAGRSQYDVNKDERDKNLPGNHPCSSDRLKKDDAFRYRLYKLDSNIAASTEEDLSKPTDNGSSAAASTDTGGSTQNGVDAVGYENGVPKNIKVVTVNDTNGKPVIKVNSEIADNVTKLIAAAKAAGLTMSSDSSFRTNEEQQYLYNCYQTQQCNHGYQAAKPGYSNHQMGYAIDFMCDSATESNESFGTTKCFTWLQQHAGEFGLKNLPSESWHWSRDGT